MGAIDLAKSMDSIDELKELVGMMDVAIKKLDEFIKNTIQVSYIKYYK
jgi:hypothetical protein